MNSNTSVSINGLLLGFSSTPSVIAELSANHNGALERALQAVDVAHQAGADSIKLQT